MTNTTFPLQGQRDLPSRVAALYLRALADEFAGLSTVKVHDTSHEDWEAVSGALEALSDALDWIVRPY